MVVQNQPNLMVLRIGTVQLLQKSDEIAAVVGVTDGFRHSPAVQVQSGQERHGTQSHILVIWEWCGMRSPRGWPVGRRGGQGMNAGLLVVRDRPHAKLPASLAPPIFI